LSDLSCASSMTITLQKNGVKNFSMASHTQTI
jgi:hypothetical protein